MSRKNTSKGGFDIASIVNTSAPISSLDNNETKKDDLKSTKNEHSNTKKLADKVDQGDPIDALIKKRKKKEQKIYYLPPELVKKVNYYGRRVGKTNGGASRVVEAALNEFFDHYKL